MSTVYLLYLLGTVVSISLYSKSRLGARIGFGICAAASGFGFCYFLTHLGTTSAFAMGDMFLYNLHFEIDPVGNFFSLVVTLISFAASIYAIQYSEEYQERGNIAVMAMLFNAFILSMLLVLSVANVFWFMVLWEVMTVISAFLICFNDSEKSLKAIMVYLGIAQIGAFALMAAFLLLSAHTGSMEFSSFANLDLSPWMASIIFLLAFIGFGSKAGMFPMHVWLPQAHPAAPSSVSALMSGVMIKVAVFGIVKFCLWLPVMEWWGLLIVIIGALSALLGVLYALTQHDYKALLAYHSVENIGIILLGIGTGVYGIAIESTTLAAVGFLAGFYHILNHATFKGLLFLGAGSVLYRTHTKDMEALGGLAKKMPLTAFSFLIGSMAITALPPLNGFVSEWVTYQAMIQGALGEGIASRLVFALSVVALALTGALAIMCFVKVYGVIFGGTPRNRKIYDKAKEAEFSMLAGMGILVAGCFAFGLGANKVVASILSVVTTFTGEIELAGAGGTISSPMGSFISPPLIMIVLISSLSLPFIIVAAFKANRIAPRETDPWACGFKYDQRMQITASPFTGDLRKLMDWLFRSGAKVEDQGYFKPVKYTNHARDIWWDYIYKPTIDYTSRAAHKIGVVQNGSTNLYSFYILGDLCLFMMIAYLLEGGLV